MNPERAQTPEIHNVVPYVEAYVTNIYWFRHPDARIMTELHYSGIQDVAPPEQPPEDTYTLKTQCLTASLRNAVVECATSLGHKMHGIPRADYYLERADYRELYDGLELAWNAARQGLSVQELIEHDSMLAELRNPFAYEPRLLEALWHQIILGPFRTTRHSLSLTYLVQVGEYNYSSEDLSKLLSPDPDV